MPLARLARETDVGLRTLERWHARYRADGYAGLETASRGDAGSRRLPPDLVDLIEGLALSKPRPAIATIHRKVTGICAARRWPVPSYSVVWDIVRTLDPGMVTLALEGAASYRDKHELVLRRQAELPNAMWQSDHTMLDILVVGTDGKPARPWLTTILDDCSRAVCGYTVFLGAPSAMNTALALRQAIWHKTDPAWPMCGLPDVLYVDHGSDFTSDQLSHTAVDLHIRLIHSTVARPQGRGKIERFFGTINTELLATLPGHITEGHPWPTPKLSLAALDSALEAFVATYNDRTHSELGTSPRSAWIADGWLPRMPESLEDLDRLLLTVAKTRVVRRDGIRFQGLRYVSPTLAGYVGRSVVIRYDPRDITEIRVFDHDEFVCKAVNQEHHDQAVRRRHTIGLCFGSAGVGKTLSARRYAHYEKAHDLLTYWGPRSDNDAKIYAALNRSRTVLYTPSVLTTPRTLKDELTQAITRTNICIEQHLVPPGTATPEAWGWRHGRNYVELIIVDEAERLRPAALELLRDRYDRDDIPLILIGMPGLEKQFSHYPQFYSRVGFAHQYRPLGQDELLFVLERHWRSLGKTLDPDDFTDAQAIAAIARITRGNFRLLERLFPQIQRVLKINELDTITNDVIEAAQSTLVIGVT